MTSGGTAEAAHSLDNQADRERTVKGKYRRIPFLEEKDSHGIRPGKLN